REPAQTLPIKPGHSAVCLHHEVGSPKPTMPAEGNGNGFTLLMVARPDVVVIIKFGIRCYGYPGCILDSINGLEASGVFRKPDRAQPIGIQAYGIRQGRDETTEIRVGFDDAIRNERRPNTRALASACSPADSAIDECPGIVMFIREIDEHPPAPLPHIVGYGFPGQYIPH